MNPYRIKIFPLARRNYCHKIKPVDHRCMYTYLQVFQSVSKTSETTNKTIFTETKILVHFYKKIPGHHHFP